MNYYIADDEYSSTSFRRPTGRRVRGDETAEWNNARVMKSRRVRPHSSDALFSLFLSLLLTRE